MPDTTADSSMTSKGVYTATKWTEISVQFSCV